MPPFEQAVFHQLGQLLADCAFNATSGKGTKITKKLYIFH
jgi:hypothetical protein